MEPRGQLWFELQRVCQDFRDFSGLPPTQALQTLISVLGNLLAEQQEELAKARAAAPVLPPDAGGPPRAERG